MSEPNMGVMLLAAYKKRTLEIARGEYVPQRDEPKIWFETPEDLAHALSDPNRTLLALLTGKMESDKL